MRLTTLLRPTGGLGRSNIYRVAALKTRLCSQQTAAATRPLSTTISTKPEAVGAPLNGGAPLRLPLPRPVGTVSNSYCDDDLRVSRGGRGGVFVLRRLARDLNDR